MRLKPDYKTFETLLQNIMTDLAVLSGDIVGPSNSCWQDVAGTLAANMTVYAQLLHEARESKGEACLSFPSPFVAIVKIV